MCSFTAKYLFYYEVYQKNIIFKQTVNITIGCRKSLVKELTLE